jgi:LPS-assembly lipoprotein
MLSKYLIYLCLLPTLLLTGCGFKLRGAETFAFQRLYIQADPKSTLTLEVKRSVHFNPATQVVSNLNEADAILQILSSTREQQVISLNRQGQVLEYRLVQQIRFSLRNHQQQFLIAPTELTLSRDLTYNAAAVLAKEVEQAKLYQSMDEDMAQQIVRRLAAIKTLTPIQTADPSQLAPLQPTP